MANPIQREKMYEALAYFSAHVRHGGQIKLFKLLYYLDLLHFRRTGRTTTGLTYEAWPMGPVPPMLNREFNDERSELRSRFHVERFKRLDDWPPTPTIDSDADELERIASGGSSGYSPGQIKPKTPYKHLYLTRREQGLASVLAEIFRDATAAQMSDVSHNKFGPWRKALHKSKQAKIERPEIDLLEGVVAVGKKDEELPVEELNALVAERARLVEALR